MLIRRCLFVLILLIFTSVGFLHAQQPAYLDTSLSPRERAHDLVGRMTLEEKAAQLEDWATSIPRLGVPDYQTWNEALHGVARAGYATVFPQAIGMAGTWDRSIVKSMGDVISIEARAKYNQAQREGNHRIFYGLTFWSPNINIFRDPRWGRGQETYGEDPFLTGQIGIAFVTGVQGEDPDHPHAIATSKHFAVHSGPEPLRHGFNVNVSPRDLEETYLPAFRATVTEGHVQSVMCAYNAVDECPACTSKMLLKEYLRDAIAATGKPLIVVLQSGSAVALNWANQHASAILEAWYPGVEGGTAIAHTLSGRNNPAGRLPVTFYTSLSDLPSFTDYSLQGRTYRYYEGKPLWGFGYGLSYTTFRYGPVKLSTETLKAGDPISATVAVTNTGKVAGDEVVEVYLKTPQQGGPIHSLVGFGRITLDSGASKEVSIKIDPRSLSSVDDQGNRAILAGKYTLSVGGAQPQETDAKSEAKFTITGTKSLPK